MQHLLAQLYLLQEQQQQQRQQDWQQQQQQVKQKSLLVSRTQLLKNNLPEMTQVPVYLSNR